MPETGSVFTSGVGRGVVLSAEVSSVGLLVFAVGSAGVAPVPVVTVGMAVPTAGVGPGVCVTGVGVVGVGMGAGVCVADVCVCVGVGVGVCAAGVAGVAGVGCNRGVPPGVLACHAPIITGVHLLPVVSHTSISLNNYITVGSW